MATYLSGSQDFAREVGIDPGPTDTTTQTGELNRIVKWYRDAYTEIQDRTAWRWLRHGFTLNTVADTQAYAYGSATDSTSASAITRFGRWYLQDLNDPPKCYLNSAGVGAQYFLSYVPWEWFNTIYNISSQSSGPPAHISVDPQDQIVLGPTPNDVYVITGEYYRSTQILAADADTPEMPSQYHDLIWKWALKKYGTFEVASEVIARFNSEALPRMRQLERNQGPEINRAPPLC